MASTVIDSLVVLLGLDASNYKKGREQAEKETKETARVAKGSADDITKALTEVGRTVATLFLGFESATGFAKFLGNLNSGEAALGRTAQRLGISAHELNKWGLAADLAGGSAADAQASFDTLTQAALKFQSGQGSSPILDLLRQAQVNPFRSSRASSAARAKFSEELARKTAHWGSVWQAARFKAAGIADGEISYLIKSDAQRAAILEKAERQNAVDAGSVEQAQALQQTWREIGQAITSAGQTMLSQITPALKIMFDALLGINGQTDALHTTFNAVGLIVKFLASAVLAIKNTFFQIGDAIGGVAAAMSALFRGDIKGALAIIKANREIDQQANADTAETISRVWDAPPGTAAAKAAGPSTAAAGTFTPSATSKAGRFNNPGNILDAQGNERRYATLGEGQAALEKDLAIKMRRGLRTVDAIITAYEGNDNVHNNIPAYIADVKKRLGKNDLSEADIKSLAQAIAMHESPGVQSGPTPGVARGTIDRGGGGGNSTTVSVGAIHVNAPNADPNAVADKIPAAIQRKLDVTQAAQGQS